MSACASWPLPAGAVDCHTHVFGPPDRFPSSIASIYPLPETPFEVHKATMDAAGFARAVLIQPAPYAQDVSPMADALQRAGGRLCGVASARSDVDDAQLSRMNGAGVRALRFLEARTPAGDRYPGSVEIDELAPLAERMKALGWHVELWSTLDQFLDFWPALEKHGLPIVLDHMGGFDAKRGVDDPAFQRLLGLVGEGAVSVKLTLCRRAPFGSDFAELRPFHDALVEANPDQMLWGSDWPFVRMGEHAPTIGGLLDLFGAWVDDDGLRRRILVDNPARRYAAP